MVGEYLNTLDNEVLKEWVDLIFTFAGEQRIALDESTTIFDILASADLSPEHARDTVDLFVKCPDKSITLVEHAERHRRAYAQAKARLAKAGG